MKVKNENHIYKENSLEAMFALAISGDAAESTDQAKSHYLPEKMFRQFFQLCDGLSLSQNKMFQVFNSQSKIFCFQKYHHY